MDWLTSSKFDTFERPGDLIDEYWRLRYGSEKGCPYHQKVIAPLKGQQHTDRGTSTRPKTPKSQPKKKKKLDLDPVKYQSLLIKSRNELAKSKDKELKGCGIERWPEAAQEAADTDLAWRRPLARPRASASPKRPSTANGIYLENSPTIAAFLDNFKEKSKSPGSLCYGDNLAEMYDAMMLASADCRRSDETSSDMMKSQQLVDRILAQVYSGEAPASPSVPKIAKPSLSRPGTATEHRGTGLHNSNNVQFILNNDEESLAGLLPGSFPDHDGLLGRLQQLGNLFDAGYREGHEGSPGQGISKPPGGKRSAPKNNKEVYVRGSAFPYRQKGSGIVAARSGGPEGRPAKSTKGWVVRKLRSEVQTSRNQDATDQDAAAGEGQDLASLLQEQRGSGIAAEEADLAAEVDSSKEGDVGVESEPPLPQEQLDAVEAAAHPAVPEAEAADSSTPSSLAPSTQSAFQRPPMLFSPGMLASKKGNLKHRETVTRGGVQEPTAEMREIERGRRLGVWQELCALVEQLGVARVAADDFDIGGLLGRGKFAGVYMGTHRNGGGSVALKVAQFTGHMDPGDWADAASRSDYADQLPSACTAEYTREIAALAGVGAHPHIVSLIGVSDRPLLIALEFIDGGNLPAFLEENEWRLNPKMLVKIMYDISAGLSFMHSRGYAHRDVKSHNVMVAIRGSTYFAKICDLGAAALVGEGGLRGPCGTLGYTAPEVYSDSPYTQAVDVFGFAVVGWEIFDRRGMNPLLDAGGADGEALLVKLRGGVRPLLGESHPASVKEIVQACWQTEPSKRPTMIKVSSVLSEMVTDTALFTRVINDANHILDRLHCQSVSSIKPLLDDSEDGFEALRSRSPRTVKKLSSQELSANRRRLSTAVRVDAGVAFYM